MTANRPEDSDHVLARILLEREQAGSRAADVEAYVRQYPHLEGEIRDLLRLEGVIDRAQAPPAEVAEVPERLGEFRIVRLLARGGMGDVYEAVQESLDERRVVVKTIRRGHPSPVAQERFLREQAALARLHQTHIVPVYAAGKEGVVQYFAMPFIDGATLHHVVQAVWREGPSLPCAETPTVREIVGQLRDRERSETRAAASSLASAASREGEFSSASAKGMQPGRVPGGLADPLVLSEAYFLSVAEVMAEAAEAVQYVHDAEVLHRDLKPSNLMVGRDGRCWLIDFGLASLREEADAAGGVPAALRGDPVTVSGVMGTPQYMAPEQWRQRADVRSDVWGLGTTLYELLTLRRAFDGETNEQVRAKVEGEVPAPPGALVGNVPADLAAVCLKALEKDVGRRYQTAQEFADDLRRWLRHEPTIALGASLLRRLVLWAWRNSGWALAIGLGLFTLLALAVTAVAWARAAEDRAAAKERALTLVEMERLKGSKVAGWFKDFEALAVPLARKSRGREDSLLRDHFASGFAGLDARAIKTIESVKVGFSSVAFDKTGERLVLGGWLDDGLGTEAMLFEMPTGKETRLGQSAIGPVAFRRDGVPLQLSARDTRTVELRALGTKDAPVTLKVPASGAGERLTPDSRPTLALSADGSWAAVSVSGKLAVWRIGDDKPVLAHDLHATAVAFSGTFSKGRRKDGVRADKRRVSRWNTRKHYQPHPPRLTHVHRTAT